MKPKLTNAQRSWLEDIEREPRAVVDVSSGGASQCLSRLERMGYVQYVSMEDWRDSYYRITDAGRAAIAKATTPEPHP